MDSDIQVFHDTVNFRNPSRVLYHFGCTPDLHKRLQDHVGGDGDYARHYGLFRPWGLSPRRPEGEPEPDYSRYWDDYDIPEGAWINGNGVLEVPSGFYHFTGYVSPLRNARSLQEIEEFPIPDQRQWDVSHYAETIARAHGEGRIATTWAGHMYEIAWQIRGYEPFLMDLLERPAWPSACWTGCSRTTGSGPSRPPGPGWMRSTAATTLPTSRR
ncbi:MAG: hypothetical protein ACLFV7_09260 [Phycisphaerae bacterium]